MAISELSPGIHPRVPSSVYHKRELGVVSKSVLDLVRRSPLHYLSWVKGELSDEDTPALSFGRAFHTALLEPGLYDRDYAVEPEWGDCRKTANKERRDQWRAEHYGTTLLAEDDDRSIRGMVAAVRRHSLASKMIREGDAEMTIVWKDSETGLTCKSRMDYYVQKRAMIVDVKSTLDARSENFRRDVAKYSYHVQDALYRFGASSLELPVQHFVFVAVEKTPPYAVAIFSLDAESIGRGYSAARRDIDTLADCLKRNHFPGYPPGIQEIDVPPWAA